MTHSLREKFEFSFPDATIKDGSSFSAAKANLEAILEAYIWPHIWNSKPKST